MLKDCQEHISQPLCHILNLSVKTACVLTIWKVAKVLPIHKSGAYDNPGIYRPISVLPVLSKLLEKAIHSQLFQYLEKNNLLTKYQFGYRPKRSTNLAATLLVDEIRREVDRGNLVGAVFLDL